MVDLRYICRTAASQLVSTSIFHLPRRLSAPVPSLNAYRQHAFLCSYHLIVIIRWGGKCGGKCKPFSSSTATPHHYFRACQRDLLPILSRCTSGPVLSLINAFVVHSASPAHRFRDFKAPRVKVKALQRFVSTMGQVGCWNRGSSARNDFHTSERAQLYDQKA